MSGREPVHLILHEKADKPPLKSVYPSAKVAMRHTGALLILQVVIAVHVWVGGGYHLDQVCKGENRGLWIEILSSTLVL